jgi:hypothetical protein
MDFPTFQNFPTTFPPSNRCAPWLLLSWLLISIHVHHVKLELIIDLLHTFDPTASPSS